jgi:Fis family transcriptional regulator
MEHNNLEHNTKKDKELRTELPLREHVKSLLQTYYKTMTNNGTTPENVYKMIMEEAELPLIEVTMEYTGQNQSTSTHILGINRGTLRKKLIHYGMI